MTLLRFALLSAAVIPAAFAAAEETADPEIRAAASARELARAQTALRETQEALANQSAEIAAVRADAAAIRIQLGKARAAAGALPVDTAALESERTAHIATKAVLARREAQVQELTAERTRLESELRVLNTSADLARTTATSEAKAILGRNADLAARSAALSRELNKAKSEITVVRHELREQGAKAASAAEALRVQLAASQKALGAAKSGLEAASAAKAQVEARHDALQRRLAELERDAQTAIPGAPAWRERLEKAEAAPKPTPADPAALQLQDRQLAALEQELTTTRTQLTQTKAALEAALGNAARPATAADAEAQVITLRETNATLQRELTAANAAARMQDRPTITEGELALLRDRAAAARDLEQRVQHLEAERTTMAERDAPDHGEAAHVVADTKPDALLRSYAPPARGRDPLREQLPPPAYPPERARAPASGGVPLGQPAFSHRIAPGETLASIARRYYGNPQRWPELVAANRDVLPDQRSFTAGKMIRIP